MIATAALIASALTMATSPSAEAATTYKLPWAAGTWDVLQGRHSDSAWDLQPQGPGNRFNNEVLAIGAGTAKLHCTDKIGQATVKLTVASATFTYAHLQTSAVKSAGITTGGVSVKQGQVLGRLLPVDGDFGGDWPTYCGRGTTSHLHLGMPSVPITIDGIQFSNSGPGLGKTVKSTNTKPAEDKDKDGVLDSKDKCPSTAGLTVNKGCPSPLEKTERGLASGDFDGDGFDDLAIGAPGEDVPGAADGGLVNIAYGAVNRIDTSRNAHLYQGGDGGLAGTAEPSDLLGSALASGDFDGNGYDDLAIGVPAEDTNGGTDAGLVSIVPGAETGLDTGHDTVLYQGTTGKLGGTDEKNDYLGTSLASGDLDGDGFDDLVIGVPGENVGDVEDAGLVNVVFGSVTGLDPGRVIAAYQGGGGLVGDAESGDILGHAVAAGDFDGDGRDDLAMGAPGEDVDDVDNAGLVNIAEGSATTGLDLTADRHIYQGTKGLLTGTQEAGDYLGGSLASGDFDGDGRDDLAVGVPGEDVGELVDAGLVDAVFGSASGLDVGREQDLYQGHGLAGDAELADTIAGSLAAADIDGDGRDDLAVGAPGENVGDTTNAGLAVAIYGAAGKLNTSRTVQLYQGQGGLAGGAESGDFLGGAVATGDLDGDGRADLVIGAPGENVGSTVDAGVVNLIDGAPTGLDLSDDDDVYQGAGLKGTAETSDFLGGGRPTSRIT